MKKLFLLLAATLVLAGCKKDKEDQYLSIHDMQYHLPASSVSYVGKSASGMKGGVVPESIILNIPANWFNPWAYVYITPTQWWLGYEESPDNVIDRMFELPMVTLTGESIGGENSVPYATGRTITFSCDDFDYPDYLPSAQSYGIELYIIIREYNKDGKIKGSYPVSFHVWSGVPLNPDI